MDHDNEFYRQIDQAERERRAKERKEKWARREKSFWKAFLFTEDGKPTADLTEAQKVTDPNYNMSITKLKNKIGEVYVAINKASAVVK